MIEQSILDKYGFPTLSEFLIVVGNTEIDYYGVFLIATDYVPNKLIEAQILGTSCENYTEVLQARQFARDKINQLTSLGLFYYWRKEMI